MPCATVLATRNASSINSGRRSASACASPSRAKILPEPEFALGAAETGAATRFLPQRCCQAVDDGAGRRTLGPRSERERHAMLEHRLGERHDIVDGGRKAPVDQGLGAY